MSIVRHIPFNDDAFSELCVVDGGTSSEGRVSWRQILLQLLEFGERDGLV